MTRILFILVGLVGPLAAFASPSQYICDSVEAQPPALRGKTLINLTTKEISVIENGVSKSLYDSKTVCGFSPRGGLGGLICPFNSQVSDGFLSVDLQCDRGVDPNANAVTSGSLQIQDGAGSLICYVGSTPANQLDLSNCQAQ